MKFLLINLPALGVALLCVSVGFSEAQEKHSKSGALTRKDLNQIRSLVYDYGAGISTNFDTVFPQQEVALPPDLVSLWNKDRVGTLRLLLAITVGANPEDARSAGVFALALEEGVILPLDFLYTELKTFDSSNSDGGPSDREKLVDRVQKALKKAEAAVNKPRKK